MNTDMKLALLASAGAFLLILILAFTAIYFA